MNCNIGSWLWTNFLLILSLKKIFLMFQAVLGASAVESERNLIQMETKDSNRKDLKAPIVSLTLGKKDMVCWKIHFEMCRLIITNRLSLRMCSQLQN